jgi:hypothetical protein
MNQCKRRKGFDGLKPRRKIFGVQPVVSGKFSFRNYLAVNFPSSPAYYFLDANPAAFCEPQKFFLRGSVRTPGPLPERKNGAAGTNCFNPLFPKFIVFPDGVDFGSGLDFVLALGCPFGNVLETVRINVFIFTDLP